MNSGIRAEQAPIGLPKIDRKKIGDPKRGSAKACEAVACEAAVYEAAFGDGAAAGAAEALVPHPGWRHAELLWQRILHTTLRLRARIARRAPRRLHLCENLPLGERRFVAVVEFEQQRFLVGGTPSSLVLLARLGEAPEAEAKGIPEGKQETECAFAPDASRSRTAKTAGGVQP